MLEETALRGWSLALRDLCEQTGATEAVLEFDGFAVSFHKTDGFTFTADGRVTELGDFPDEHGLVPADGVESVTQQPELLARRGA